MSDVESHLLRESAGSCRLDGARDRGQPTGWPENGDVRRGQRSEGRGSRPGGLHRDLEGFQSKECVSGDVARARRVMDNFSEIGLAMGTDEAVPIAQPNAATRMAEHAVSHVGHDGGIEVERSEGWDAVGVLYIQVVYRVIGMGVARKASHAWFPRDPIACRRKEKRGVWDEKRLSRKRSNQKQVKRKSERWREKEVGRRPMKARGEMTWAGLLSGAVLVINPIRHNIAQHGKDSKYSRIRILDRMNIKRRSCQIKHHSYTKSTASHHIYRLFAPRKTIPPTTPAARASPPTMAIPSSPSLDTFSSINCPRLAAWRLAGSFSSRRSL